MNRYEGTRGDSSFSIGLLLFEKAHYPFANYRHATSPTVFWPGCNVQSLFPETTAALSRLLSCKAGIGTVYDCCGSPLHYDRQNEKAEEVAHKVERRLRRKGVEEVVLACPNCRAMFERYTSLRVESIYRKLAELGYGEPLAADGAVFPPCPDRAKKEWLGDLGAFFTSDPTVLRRVPCCGLGHGGGPRHPEKREQMANKAVIASHEANPGAPYVYCSSCAGMFCTHGAPDVRFALAEISGTHERPHTHFPLNNRMRAKFLSKPECEGR